MITIAPITAQEEAALKDFSASEWPSADREHFGDTAKLDWSKPKICLAAKDLYLKLGYAIRAELPNYYAHRDYVLMDKDL